MQEHSLYSAHDQLYLSRRGGGNVRVELSEMYPDQIQVNERDKQMNQKNQNITIGFTDLTKFPFTVENQHELTPEDEFLIPKHPGVPDEIHQVNPRWENKKKIWQSNTVELGYTLHSIHFINSKFNDPNYSCFGESLSAKQMGDIRAKILSDVEPDTYDDFSALKNHIKSSNITDKQINIGLCTLIKDFIIEMDLVALKYKQIFYPYAAHHHNHTYNLADLKLRNESNSYLRYIFHALRLLKSDDSKWIKYANKLGKEDLFKKHFHDLLIKEKHQRLLFDSFKEAAEKNNKQSQITNFNRKKSQIMMKFRNMPYAGVFAYLFVNKFCQADFGSEKKRISLACYIIFNSVKLWQEKYEIIQQQHNLGLYTQQEFDATYEGPDVKNSVPPDVKKATIGSPEVDQAWQIYINENIDNQYVNYGSKLKCLVNDPIAIVHDKILMLHNHCLKHNCPPNDPIRMTSKQEAEVLAITISGHKKHGTFDEQTKQQLTANLTQDYAFVQSMFDQTVGSNVNIQNPSIQSHSHHVSNDFVPSINPNSMTGITATMMKDDAQAWRQLQRRQEDAEEADLRRGQGGNYNGPRRLKGSNVASERAMADIDLVDPEDTTVITDNKRSSSSPNPNNQGNMRVEANESGQMRSQSHQVGAQKPSVQDGISTPESAMSMEQRLNNMFGMDLFDTNIHPAVDVVGCQATIEQKIQTQSVGDESIYSGKVKPSVQLPSHHECKVIPGLFDGNIPVGFISPTFKDITENTFHEFGEHLSVASFLAQNLELLKHLEKNSKYAIDIYTNIGTANSASLDEITMYYNKNKELAQNKKDGFFLVDICNFDAIRMPDSRMVVMVNELMKSNKAWSMINGNEYFRDATLFVQSLCNFTNLIGNFIKSTDTNVSRKKEAVQKITQESAAQLVLMRWFNTQVNVLYRDLQKQLNCTNDTLNENLSSENPNMVDEFTQWTKNESILRLCCNILAFWVLIIYSGFGCFLDTAITGIDHFSKSRNLHIANFLKPIVAELLYNNPNAPKRNKTNHIMRLKYETWGIQVHERIIDLSNLVVTQNQVQVSTFFQRNPDAKNLDQAIEINPFVLSSITHIIKDYWVPNLEEIYYGSITFVQKTYNQALTNIFTEKEIQGLVNNENLEEESEWEYYVSNATNNYTWCKHLQQDFELVDYYTLENHTKSSETINEALKQPDCYVAAVQNAPVYFWNLQLKGNLSHLQFQAHPKVEHTDWCTIFDPDESTTEKPVFIKTFTLYKLVDLVKQEKPSESVDKKKKEEEDNDNENKQDQKDSGVEVHDLVELDNNDDDDQEEEDSDVEILNKEQVKELEKKRKKKQTKKRKKTQDGSDNDDDEQTDGSDNDDENESDSESSDSGDKKSESKDDNDDEDESDSESSDSNEQNDSDDVSEGTEDGSKGDDSEDESNNSDKEKSDEENPDSEDEGQDSDDQEKSEEEKPDKENSDDENNKDEKKEDLVVIKNTEISNEKFVIMLCNEIASLQLKNKLTDFFCPLPASLGELIKDATKKMNTGNARVRMYNSLLIFDLGIWYGKYGHLNVEDFQRDCDLENFIRICHLCCGIIFLLNWMVKQLHVNKSGKWKPKKSIVDTFLSQLKENNDVYQQVFFNSNNRQTQHKLLLSVVEDALQYYNAMRVTEGKKEWKFDLIQWLENEWIEKIEKYYSIIQQNQQPSPELFYDTFCKMDLTPLKMTIFILGDFWETSIKDFLNFVVYQLNNFVHTQNINTFMNQCQLPLKNSNDCKKKKIMNIARRCVNALFLLSSSTFWTTLSPFWFCAVFPDSVESKYWFRVVGIYKSSVGKLIHELTNIDNDPGLFFRKITKIMLKVGKIQLQLDEFDSFVDSKDHPTDSLLKFYRREYDYVIGATRDVHKSRKLMKITQYESDFVVNDLDVPYDYDDDLFVPE